MASSNKTASRRGRWIVAAAAVCVLIVVGVGAAFLNAGDSSDVSAMATFEVNPGALTISVTEPGTISARDQVVLKSEVEGRTTIIYLVEEGAQVEPGDLLVELDASALMDQKVDQEIRVQNAEAAFIRARENLAVTQNQTTADIEQAVLNYRFAQDDQRKYIEGEYPTQQTELLSQISLAEQEVKQAQDKLDWSARLREEQYISQAELESDTLAVRRAQLNVELRKADLKLLNDFTHARQLAQLESDVRQAEMALERVRRRASADIIQAEADLDAKRAERDRQQERLVKLTEQIEKCKIYAPVGGMVVYGTSGRGSWRGNAEPLTEGYEVREREELIMLPRESGMMVEVKVHESNLGKIARGQPVRVKIDALPGRTFWGRVTKIAPLPDAQSVWLNPDLKVYNTEIVLEGDLAGVRTGMTCQAEIIAERYAEAVYVPVQSVLRVGSETQVYVVKGNRIESRVVTIGLDNNQMVKIDEGLAAGDRVLLTPPLAEARRAEELMAAGVAADRQAEQIPEAIEPAAEETDADAAEAPQESAEAARPRRQMTAEQRAAFEQMTPEQRQALRARRQQQRAAQGGVAQGQAPARPAPAGEGE